MWARGPGAGGAGPLFAAVAPVVAALAVVVFVDWWAITTAGRGDVGIAAVWAPVGGQALLVLVGAVFVGRLRRRVRSALAELGPARSELAVLHDHASVGVVGVDERGRIDGASHAAERLLGADGAGIRGRELTSFASEASVGELLYALFRTASQGRTTIVTVDLQVHDRLVAAEVTVVDRSDRCGGLTVLLRDVSEQVALRRELERLVHHDELTGLPNRRSFRESLSGLVDRGSNAAVLFVDLNGFKTVNDMHGDATGDEVLVEVSHRLLHELRESDVVARLGADEFAALLYRCDVAQAQAAADRIIDAVSRPILAGEHDVELTASVGISLVDGAEMDADAVIQSADTAMYRAKAAHRASIRAGLLPCRPVDVEYADSFMR